MYFENEQDTAETLAQVQKRVTEPWQNQQTRDRNYKRNSQVVLDIHHGYVREQTVRAHIYASIPTEKTNSRVKDWKMPCKHLREETITANVCLRIYFH